MDRYVVALAIMGEATVEVRANSKEDAFAEAVCWWDMLDLPDGIEADILGSFEARLLSKGERE